MKSTIEPESPTRVRLTMEVPLDELDPELKTVSATGHEDVASFRTGRLPFQDIDRRLGTTAPTSTVQQAILAVATAAAREHDVAPLGRPEVDITSFGDGQPLLLTALMDVRPEVVLPRLSSIVVAVEPVRLDEDEVDTQIDHLRRRLATLVDVDRPAAKGDMTRIGLSVSVRGTSVGGGPDSALLYEIGSGQLVVRLDGTAVSGTDLLVAGLDATLVGLTAGEVATFTVRLGEGESAGRDAKVSVTLIAVQYRQLPALDDDFAALTGSFGSLVELRDDLRARLTRERMLARMYAARDSVLRQLATAAAVTAPEGLLRDEVQYRKQWMLAELQRQGSTLARYLAVAGRTEQDIDAELSAATAERICGQLVLDAVADTENLQITDEDYGRALVHRAQRVGVAPQAYREQLDLAAGAAELVADARRSKALALIMERVSVTNTHGNTLTVDGQIL